MTLSLSSSKIRPAAHRSEPGRNGIAPTQRRAHDERAFEALFLEHYSSLCEFVDSYVRAPDVAEELVQAVFLRLWESRDSWVPKRGARAYLFAACRNQSLDYLRHERIVARTAEVVFDFEVGQGSLPARADAALEAEELGNQLKAVVSRLPERRRLVVVLRWQYQLTNPEIARVMGISVKGVEMQFSRALADLRRELRPEAFDAV